MYSRYVITDDRACSARFRLGNALCVEAQPPDSPEVLAQITPFSASLPSVFVPIMLRVRQADEPMVVQTFIPEVSVAVLDGSVLQPASPSR